MTRCLGESMPAEITGSIVRATFVIASRTFLLRGECLGYAPRYRFADGIAELVEWLRSQTAVDKAAQMVHELTAYGLTA